MALKPTSKPIKIKAQNVIQITSARKRKFPDHPESAQPRNPIFGKNRISQTVCPNVPKQMKKKSCAQEIRFLGKIGFLKPCPNVLKK
jgi:hypothetical protein